MASTPPSPRPDPQDEDQILIDAYDQMRRMARRRVLQMGIESIQGTDLVNAAYVHLANKGKTWDDQKELFFLAGRAMRDILVQRAREKASQKRGGEWTRVAWENAAQVATEHPEMLLHLDDALQRLAEESQEAAAVVELLFYAGFSIDETAKALGISSSTVDRRWRHARAWLFDQLREEGPAR